MFSHIIHINFFSYHLLLPHLHLPKLQLVHFQELVHSALLNLMAHPSGHQVKICHYQDNQKVINLLLNFLHIHQPIVHLKLQSEHQATKDFLSPQLHKKFHLPHLHQLQYISRKINNKKERVTYSFPLSLIYQFD